jgi:hypothetical protein
MAIQGQVRALVERGTADRVVRRLVDDLEIDEHAIEVSVPAEGAYRDEEPDVELHDLVKEGRRWAPISIGVGAVLGAAIALAIPVLRETTLVTVPLFAFAGAWALTAVTTARRVQVERREDPRGETIHEVPAEAAPERRLLVVRDLRDRGPVIDLLEEEGAALLDSSHPRVGESGPGARPVDPHRDAHGPPITEDPAERRDA